MTESTVLGMAHAHRSRRAPLAWSLSAVALSCSLLLGACGTKDDATEPAPLGDPSGVVAPGDADGSASPTALPATTVPVATTTVDPGSLPQTEDKPTTDSYDFERRVRSLWEGIVEDDPAIANEFFFPLSAYKQVKSLQDPTSDWNNRLVSIYDSEIHTLHQGLGSDPSEATFEGIDVPMQNAVWINPGVEYNKLGYWRVYGTKVRYSVDGVEKSFPIQSLISWRGEWYVVHLTAPPR